MVSLTINPNKDAQIQMENPDTNYGSSISLGIQAEVNPGYGIRRALLEFDISSLIDVPIVNLSSCTLNLYDAGSVNPRTIDFRRIDDGTWVESTITWNIWAASHTSTDYNVEDILTTSWNSTSIISILKDALRDGHSYVGIYLRYVDESYDASIHSNGFRSSESSGYEPFLSIEYNTYSQTALHGSLCKNLLFKDGFGEITMTDHNCPSPCDGATFTFKTAWGSTYTTVLLDVGDTQQYDSGVMHHSFKLYSMTASSAPCDNLAAATIEEKNWEDDCYVKTTGDNDRNGTDWTEAWSTVDQAANEAFDGQEVHIGFGTYSSEPASNDIAPVNFGTTGIKYTPETAGTGGGTGSVTVERN